MMSTSDPIQPVKEKSHPSAEDTDKWANFRPTPEDNHRVLIISAFYLTVALFIGVPVWLKTTATYQAPLPFWEIKSLCSRPVEINVPVIIINLSDGLTDANVQTIQSQLENSADANYRCGSKPGSSKQFQLKCRLDSRKPRQRDIAALREYTKGSLNFEVALDKLETALFDDDSAVNPTQSCLADMNACGSLSSGYNVVILPRKLRTTLSIEPEVMIQRSLRRNLIYVFEPTETEGTTSSLQLLIYRIAEALNSIVLPMAELEEFMSRQQAPVHSSSALDTTELRSQLMKSYARQLAPSTEYDITVTILTHSGEAPTELQKSQVPSNVWSYEILSDPTEWLKSNVEGVFQSWLPYVHFNFHSQRLHAVDIERLGSSRLSENGKYRYYTRDDLSNIVNQLESYLGAPQTASAASRDLAGAKPGLHLILLLALPNSTPSDNSSVAACPLPLRFHLAPETVAGTNVAVVPQWGGLFAIDAPFPCTKSDNVGSHVGQQLVAVIRSLLGLSETTVYTSYLNPTRSSVEKMGKVEHWELDNWFLRRTVESLLAIRITMIALVDLLARFPNMVINEYVATEVTRSTQVWSETINKLKNFKNESEFGKVFIHAQDALGSINSAFFDHTLLGRLYFQEDQKFGIYVPLFVPVGIGLLLSVRNILRILFPREQTAV